MSNNKKKFWNKEELKYIAQRGGINIKKRNKNQLYQDIKKKFNIAEKKIWYDWDINELKNYVFWHLQKS